MTVNRRLVAASAATLAMTMATGALAQRQPAARPDIVLFVADDMSREDITPYDSRDARTPNLMALAKAGTLFTNAFAASPTCTVSRSALLTGDYPVRNGAHTNHSPIKPGITTLPQYLQRLGYRVVIAGKTDFGPRSSFPFEYLAGTTVHPPGKPATLQSVLGTAAIDKLLATRDKGKPLALIVADYASHVPWLPNQGFDPARLTLEPELLDTPELRASRTRYLTKVGLVDSDVGAVRASIAKYGGTANTLFLFTADQGALFPSAKYNLYDQGIATPLIASWPGHIPAGRSTGAMVSLVDVLPTLQQAAGGTAATDIDGRSFLPVLFGRADSFHTELYAAHTGERGADRNHAPSRAIRTDQYKLIENLRPDIKFVNSISSNGPGNPDTNYWASWTARIKANPKAALLVNRFYNRVPVELYDLRSDPYELRNLANDPAHAATLADLKKRLDAWRVQQGENLNKVIMPEDAADGRFPYTTCPCNAGDGAGTPNEEPGARRGVKKTEATTD